MVDVRKFKPKEANEFRTEDLSPGNHLAFLDDVSGRWQVGELVNWRTPAKDADGNYNARVVDFVTGATRDVSLSLTPKKVELPNLTINHSINGQNYRIQPNSITIHDNGLIEFTLFNITNPAERITDVNSEMLKNLDAVNKLQAESNTKINNLKAEVVRKADARGQEVLKGLSGLQQKLEEANGKLASLEEWQEMDAAEALAIGQQIKALQTELETGLKDLKDQLEAIKPVAASSLMAAEANGWKARLAREKEDKVDEEKETNETTKETATVAYDKWKKDHKKWEDKMTAYETWKLKHDTWSSKKAVWDGMSPAEQADKANKDKNPGNEPLPILPDPTASEPAEPTNPAKIKEVKEDEVKFRVSYDLYLRLVGVEYATLSPKHKSLIDKVTAEINKKIAEGHLTGLTAVGGTPKKSEVKLVAEIFEKILQDESGKTEEEDYKFDLKKEKADLKEKWKALAERSIKAGFDKVTIEARLSSIIARTDAIVDADPNKEKDILDLWKDFTDSELLTFKKEQEKIIPEKREVKQGDIDIPDILLRDLISTRQPEVRATMAAVLRNELTFGDEAKKNLAEDPAVVEALKELMKRAPSEAMLSQLRKYGIKNWESFQKLWNGGMAIKAAKVMHEWGQADLRNEVIKQTGALDQMKALKWQLGARVLVNMAAIGGGVALASTGLGAVVLGGYGLSSLGMAAAGGAVGGGIRATLQKFLFGGKKLEERKAKKLEELADNKRTEIINNVLNNRFNGASRGGVINSGHAEFSAILAEAIRAASAEANLIQGAAEDFDNTQAQSLQGDAKRLYINALKNARESGISPDKDQKIRLAIALETLISKNETIDAVQNTDPAVIKMLDGVMAGYSGAGASRENYGVKGAAGTVAIGATVGAAFFSNSAVTRGALGAAGGALMGYKTGETWRKSREFKQAEDVFTPQFNEARQMWNMYFRNPNSLTPAEFTSFGERLQTFNRYLTGEADTVEGQKTVEYILSNPQLKQQIENLVYQAYRRGVFARLSLERLQIHTEEAIKESDIKLSDSDKAAWKKAGWRALYTTAGAVVGAASAVVMGRGFQEMAKDFKHGVLHDYGHKDPTWVHAKGHGAVVEGKVAAAAAATGAAVEAHPTGAGVSAHPEAASGAAQPEGTTTHEVPAHFEKAPAVATETVASHGSAWRSMDNLHSSHKGDLFKGWSQSKFNEWRNAELENMGFKKLPNGDILHPYDVKPGAQFECYKDESGQLHMRPSEAALDKFPPFTDPKTGERIYMVEHHTGGKMTTMPVRDSHDHTLVKHEIEYNPKGAVRGESGTDYKLVKIKGEELYRGVEGKHSGQVYTKDGEYIGRYEDGGNGKERFITFDKDASQTGHHNVGPNEFKHGVLLDELKDSHGNAVRTTYEYRSDLAPAPKLEAHMSGGGTSWKQGDVIPVAEIQKIDTNVHGRLVGGGAGVKEVVPTIKTVGSEVKVGDAQPTDNTKNVAPIKGTEATVTTAQGTEKLIVPEGFTGKEAQFMELRSIKGDLVNSLFKDKVISVNDKIGLIPGLMDKVQTVLSQNPGLLKDQDISRALDVNQHLSSADRYSTIVGVLEDKHAINLSVSERLLLGGNNVIGDDFEHVKGNIDGVDYDMIVAKGDGADTYRMRNLQDNSVMVVTDPKIKFNTVNIAESLKQ